MHCHLIEGLNGLIADGGLVLNCFWDYYFSASKRNDDYGDERVDEWVNGLNGSMLGIKLMLNKAEITMFMIMGLLYSSSYGAILLVGTNSARHNNNNENNKRNSSS